MSASFGELLRRGRDEAGLSQSRLGHLIGKSPTTIRSWEHGRTNPSDPQTVAAIAAILALDEVELLNTAGFEATPVKVHRSAREELTSLASERTELIALAPQPSEIPIASAPAHSPLVVDSPPVVDLPVIADEPAGEDLVEGEDVADAAREIPIVVMPPKPQVSPTDIEPDIALAGADIPITVTPTIPIAVIADVAPSTTTTTEPKTETTITKVRMPKVRMVVNSPTPTQSGSNGYVAGRSYLEDQDEKEFYRRRGLITGAVLVFMVIVIWWALGRTGGAIGDFIESIVGQLDI